MLRTYIYNEDKKVWLEEESLLLHDLCAILDEDDNFLYIWNGPKSPPERLEKGYNLIEILLKNHPDLNLKVIKLEKEIPTKIKKKIDDMLTSIKSDEEDFLQFTRFSTIRIFFLSSLVIIALSVLSLLNLMRHSDLLNWTGNVAIRAENYETWINITKYLVIFSLCLFILNIGIGVLENEHQVIVFSAAGIIICIGIIFYLNQGIYLFLFQERSSSSFYIIARSDINWFFITILAAEFIYLIPITYKLTIFVRHYHEYLF
jgi:hypothetical protein